MVSEKARRIAAGIVGIIVGAICSVLINSTLIEVAVNTVFSVYFGLIFAAIGSMILYRTYREGQKVEPTVVRRASDTFLEHPIILYSFGALMVLSGILCFVLQKDWFIHVNYIIKIPFFAFLGAALAFLIVLLVADCVSYCSLICNSAQARPMIEGSNQFYLLTGTAILMGAIYGFLFGVLDMEDVNQYRLAVLALKEEMWSLPIGGLLGGICGYLNEILRQHGGDWIVDANDSKYQGEI